jgi:hypothetical protein
MSKHRRGHHRMKGLAGLGNIRTAGALGRDVLPGLIGIGLTLGGALAVRSFVRPDPGPMATTYRWAPAIGGGIGLLGAGVLAGAMPSARGQAMAVASTSVLSAALVLGIEQLNVSRPGAMMAIANVPAAPAATPTAGLGALVAETRTARQLRGVVMEPAMRGVAGDFGDSVSAPIRGSVNPSAFGRPQSSVG